MESKKSQKAVLIEKAKSSTSLVISVVVGLVVFSGFSMKALYAQMQHKNVVIKEKKVALDTLKTNVEATKDLVTAFEKFEEMPESVIGTSDRNSKIVLDALPPAYDFPALASSLEKVLTDGGYTISGITGTDNETTETEAIETGTVNGPVSMDFTIAVQGEFAQLRNLLPDLERSIRPIYVKSVNISGTTSTARMTVNAATYYQPAIKLNLQFKEITP